MWTNGAKPSAVAEHVSTETTAALDIRSDKLDQLLGEIGLLAAGINEAKSYWSKGGADLERATSSLSARLDTLPARIADAITEALAKQHRMIVSDVQSALREFAVRLESLPPTTSEP